MPATLYIIVPCYNEADCLPKTAPMLRNTLEELITSGMIDKESRILFVDDGSSDGTWDYIRFLHDEDPIYAGIHLSCNRGHQNAVVDGLMEATNIADITISIDADLQDDVGSMKDMIKKYYEGYHIVCGVRSSRETDTFFKRFTAQSYYAIMNIFGAKLIYNHADYRLMDRIAIEKLLQYHTDDPFLRGIITRLGLPIATVEYARAPRVAGQSKYSLKKMIHLAIRGISCGRLKPSAISKSIDPYISTRLFR